MMTWRIIRSREVTGSAGSGEWSEYLCYRAVGTDVHLAICMHEIAAVPTEWYNNEGELLTEFADKDGRIALPVTINGEQFEAFDGEYLRGDIGQDPNLPEIVLEDLNVETVREALEVLEWSETSPNEIAQVVQEAINCAKGGTD